MEVPGMTYKTLRDEIAMAALTGLLADPITMANFGTAKLAYQLADWMLKARESSSTESPTRTSNS